MDNERDIPPGTKMFTVEKRTVNIQIYTTSNNSFFADGPTNVFKHVLTSINMISLPPKWFIDIDHEHKDLNKPFVGFHQLGPCRYDFSRVVKKQIILIEGVC